MKISREAGIICLHKTPDNQHIIYANAMHFVSVPNNTSSRLYVFINKIFITYFTASVSLVQVKWEQNIAEFNDLVQR